MKEIKNELWCFMIFNFNKDWE